MLPIQHLANVAARVPAGRRQAGRAAPVAKLAQDPERPETAIGPGPDQPDFLAGLADRPRPMRAVAAVPLDQTVPAMLDQAGTLALGALEVLAMPARAATAVMDRLRLRRALAVPEQKSAVSDREAVAADRLPARRALAACMVAAAAHRWEGERPAMAGKESLS